MTDMDSRVVQAEQEARAACAAADDARTLLVDLEEDGYRADDLDAARTALNVAVRHLEVHRRRHLSIVQDTQEITSE